MKKNLIKFTQRVGILLSILFCILCCQKEVEPCFEKQEEKQKERLSNPTVEAARLFHESQAQGLSLIFTPRPSSASRSVSGPGIRWEAASVEENDFHVSVSAPLFGQEMDSVLLKMQQEQGVVTQKVSVTSRLVVRKNKWLNFTHQYLTSTLQIVSSDSIPLSRTSTSPRTLTLEYNMERQLINMHDIKDGKMRLMVLAKEGESTAEAYEVEIDGKMQKIVPYSSSEVCPVCGYRLTKNVCPSHGYIIDDVYVLGDYDPMFRNIHQHITRIIDLGIDRHRSSSCNNYCQTHMPEVRWYVGGCFVYSFPITKPIADVTNNFVQPWSIIPSYWDEMVIKQDWNGFLQELRMCEVSIISDIAWLVYDYEQSNVPSSGSGGGGNPGQEGGGGGDDSNPNPNPEPDPIPGLDSIPPIPLDSAYAATLTTSTSWQGVVLMGEYQLNYTINSSASFNVVSAEILMSRQGRNNWKSVAQLPPNQTSYTRKAITPGYWDIRAEIVVMENGVRKEILTNTVLVEEAFPERGIIGSHLDYSVKAMELWDIAVDFAYNNQSSHAVQEVGCFVYLNTETGEYSFGELIYGPIVYLIQAVEVTVPFQWGDRDVDPRETYVYEVATLHSHYPLTWAAPFFARSPGPSDRDRDSKMPGWVYDYTNPVESGDVPDRYSKTVYPYGEERRATPKI